MAEPRLVLNMIVKDEAPIISSFLDTVVPFIDAWAIMDTGSTDGTPDIIEKKLTSLPGRLSRMEWQGFATCRNAAIDLAQGLGDYLMFLDADDRAEIEGSASDFKSQLTHDLHHGMLRQLDTRYPRIIFAREGSTSRYRGVIHEVLIPATGEHVGPTVSGFLITRGGIGVGHRSTRGDEKYRDDARLLEEALAEGRDPDFRERYQFYLAQSYRDCGEKAKAVDAYRRRLEMTGGYQQERYVAAINLGALLEDLRAAPQESLMAYLHAREIDPSRNEAHHRIAALARRRGMWNLAFEHALQASALPPRPDKLFVDGSVSEWRAHLEVALSAEKTGRWSEGLEASRAVLRSVGAPTDARHAVARLLPIYAKRVDADAPNSLHTP